MIWLNNQKCELCPNPAVMAFMSHSKKVLCRLCEACHAKSEIYTEYEAWRGDYLESLEDSHIGDATNEYLVRWDK